MAPHTLLAYANGRLVGILAEEGGVWSFTYGEAWRACPQAFALSPALPLGRARVVDGSTQRPVQWFFDNLLPEEGMRAALAREVQLDAGDTWGLLSWYGRESAGALTLLHQSEREPAGSRLVLPLSRLEARLQGMPQQALTAASPKRMSAAGAQQKLLLILEGQFPRHTLFDPQGAEPSLHLLKPDMRAAGYPHSAINEFFCARLGQALGLAVPQTHFVRVPSPCYVIDRFDRDTSVRPARRLHILDATQLLNKDKAFKYHSANVESLVACIAMLDARASARLAIYRWSIFNVLVGNGDAHLKNLSFFSTSRGYQLAPFYDLLSTVVYHTPSYGEQGGRDGQWPRCALSMPLGQARHFHEIGRAHVLAFGEALGLRRIGAIKELDRLLGELPAQLARVRAEVDIIARPDAGEARLLNMIAYLPLAEMQQALRQ